MITRQPTPGVHENFAADVADTKPQPLGYIAPAALEQLRLGIDCQPIHKDTRHGFTVPIFDHPPRMPEPITPPPPQSHLSGMVEQNRKMIARWKEIIEDGPEGNEPLGNVVRKLEQTTDALAALVVPAPVSNLMGLDEATKQKLREALRFSASRSVMSAEDERRILAALATREGSTE